MTRTLPLLIAALVVGCAGTRPADIGVVEGGLTTCPSPRNCVSSGPEDEAHGIAPLTLRVPAERAWPVAREAVLSLPRTVIASERANYLHAECTSALVGYVDDLELYLDESGERIQVRSASRLGYGDGGVNRERVETLRASLAAMGIVEAAH